MDLDGAAVKNRAFASPPNRLNRKSTFLVTENNANRRLFSKLLQFVDSFNAECGLKRKKKRHLLIKSRFFLIWDRRVKWAPLFIFAAEKNALQFVF